MPSVPRILQQRHRRHSKYSGTGHQAGLIAVFFLSLPIAFIFIFGALRYTDISRDLPSTQTLPVLLEPPTGAYLEPTRLYDSSGESTLFTLEHPLLEEHRYASYSIDGNSDIPQILVDALVANLDPHFWRHPGVPIEWPVDSQEPSIAQRIVLDLLLWEEPPSREKDLRSALLAVQITNQYGREKIVEWYLNSAYFGNHLYGIHAASQVYFGKPVEEIEVHEAAALTSILQSPALNPLDAPNAVIEGQQAALESMYNYGWIDEDQALQALQTSLIFNDRPIVDNPFENPFVRYVISQLEPIIDPALVERGGFNIITTLDKDIQTQVNCVIQAQNSILSPEVDEGRRDNLQTCPAARMLPQMSSAGQNIESTPQTNVVVLEPSTGKIRALAGNTATWNLAANSPSSGTLVTPFIYLTAFTRGYTPSTLVWDIPETETASGVENLDGIYHGPMRARTALANDYLSTTDRLLTSIGEENVSRTIANFGLEPAVDKLLPQGIQTTLLDFVHAYSAFVNGGRMIGKESISNGNTEIYPVAVEQVIDVSGYLWLAEEQPREIPVITPQLAYLIFDILKDETSRWPSLGHPNKLEIGRPATAKMGVVPGETHGWTIGYSSSYMVGVWTGAREAESTEIDIDLSIEYADSAASIWQAIQRYIVQDEPILPQEIPVGINNRNVCDPSGLLPTQDCPTIVNEVFIAGTEPTQPDNLYQAFQINRETGRLATVFTPPELIDEKVYLVVPPEAQVWAAENDIPVPPETSDIIFRPSVNENAVIRSPEMFENVHGEAVIRGTAAGDRFVSYRVQVGAGLNPQSWIQIESDQTTQISNGVLTTWDTEGYSGLYAVQLVVVRDDQSVDTSTIQVTVDNQAPSLEILYPAEEQSIPYQAGETITFLAEAGDNVSVERIEFYIGDRFLGEVTQEPYAVPWRMSPGDFSLKLIAYDLAGNITEGSVNFVVDR